MERSSRAWLFAIVVTAASSSEFHNAEDVKALDTSATPVDFPVVVTDTTADIMVIGTTAVVRAQ